MLPYEGGTHSTEKRLKLKKVEQLAPSSDTES